MFVFLFTRQHGAECLGAHAVTLLVGDLRSAPGEMIGPGQAGLHPGEIEWVPFLLHIGIIREIRPEEEDRRVSVVLALHRIFFHFFAYSTNQQKQTIRERSVSHINCSTRDEKRETFTHLQMRSAPADDRLMYRTVRKGMNGQLAWRTPFFYLMQVSDKEHNTN